MMIGSVREYSFHAAPLFLWDVEEEIHSIVPLIRDVPIVADNDAQNAFGVTPADRRKKLLFHVQSGDYFGMLATALGFVEEKLNRSVDTDQRDKAAEVSDEVLLVRDLRNDLRYLHDNFDIYPKKSWSDPA